VTGTLSDEVFITLPHAEYRIRRYLDTIHHEAAFPVRKREDHTGRVIGPAVAGYGTVDHSPLGSRRLRFQHRIESMPISCRIGILLSRTYGRYRNTHHLQKH
jgi:hypothetical protein